MEKNSGGSRPEGENRAVFRPSSEGLPISPVSPVSEEVDAQTQASLLTFTAQAAQEIHRLISEYGRKLVQASVAVRERDSGDNVSAANVREAHINMSRPEGRGMMIRLAGIFGGILLGTGLSTLASMIQAGVFTGGGTTFAVLAGAVGAFGVALDLAGSFWRKRTQ